VHGIIVPLLGHSIPGERQEFVGKQYLDFLGGANTDKYNKLDQFVTFPNLILLPSAFKDIKAEKKYQYETIHFGTLYLNSLSIFISNKFAAEIKKQDYGKVLIFDVDKLERFEDLYSDSHLKGDNSIKIEVRLKEPNSDYDDSDNSDDYDNIL
jgi:hypothetical protein